MKRLIAPFVVRGKAFANNIFYAPLAGCSDYPFRKVIVDPRLSHTRPGLFFCEMVKADALIRDEPTTYRLLDYDHSMHPIGAQICGSNPDYICEAARRIEDLGFDWIDLNCGCPVDKITKDGSGSALLQKPEKIGEILQKMVRATDLPISVKIRSGWDDDSINAPLITTIAEQAGASLITIHGRTREQGYKGKAAFSPIREAKKKAKTIYVFANGDIFDPLSAEKMWEETNADGILIARGTMGRPWIAEELVAYFQRRKKKEISPEEVRQWWLAHFEEIFRYQPDKKACLDMRRVGSWFLKQLPPHPRLKEVIMKEKDPRKILALLREEGPPALPF
ncbi:MAG: tRNA dihydrouridine synthase DusB [Chlamydiota bacterium]